MSVISGLLCGHLLPCAQADFCREAGNQIATVNPEFANLAGKITGLVQGQLRVAREEEEFTRKKQARDVREAAMRAQLLCISKELGEQEVSISSLAADC